MTDSPIVLFWIQHLSKTYYIGDVAVQALKNIDLELYEGADRKSVV